MALRRLFLALILAHLPVSAVAQTWNDAATSALVARAVARRQERQADSTLHDYRVRAHGFVFFLGQLAEGLREPPRLIRSDELQVEVYWKAPNRSKQQVIGWRDRTDLPTDIQYHRDHLGIVQNNFGNRIRIGEGDEVRDVPHPLAPDGPRLYDYALVDSLTIQLPNRTVRVYEVRVRPKDFGQPRVIGTLYFDTQTAELIIFRFSFTRRAYLDPTLEDITVVLESALWHERYWLPRRQEIEIRRRTSWLDLPARGIIRGRWEIGDYHVNVGLTDALFGGSEIVFAPKAARDSFPWTTSLDAAIRAEAGPVMTFDLEAARAQIDELATGHAITGLAAFRPAVGSLSDLLHFNRVEGLAPGFGWVVRSEPHATDLHAWASYGVSDHRVKGELDLTQHWGGYALSLDASRRVVDLGDTPVIAPLLNSLLAQEVGEDFGDWVLRERGQAEIRRDFGVRGGASLAVAMERTTSLATAAAPASGTFRPNPALGSGTLGVARLRLERRSPELAVSRAWSGDLELEAGLGDTVRYLRVRGAGRAQVAVGATRLVGTAWGGFGTEGLPPHRAFVFGGRGTLIGESYRAWGGRAVAVATLEWQVPVPFPFVTLGPGVTTGRRVIVAPFVGAGWAADSVPGTPWTSTGGVRPVAGIAVEWFHRFIRATVGVRLRDPALQLVVGVTPDLWSIS